MHDTYSLVDKSTVLVKLQNDNDFRGIAERKKTFVGIFNALL